MNTTKQTLLLFWRLAKKNPVYLSGMIVSDIIGMILFRVIPPLYAAEIIRRLGSGDYISGDFWGSFSQEILIFAISLFLGGVVFRRLELFFRFKLEMHVEKRIKTMMHDKYLELDTAFHADNFSGSLTSRSNKLVTSYIRFADSVAHPTIQMLSIVVSIYIIVAQVALSFLVLFTVVAAIFIAIAIKLSPWVSRIFIQKADADNENTGLLADSITNVVTIKSYANSNYERNLFDNSTEKAKRILNKAGMAVLLRDSFFGTITTLFSIAAMIVAIIAIVDQNASLATVFLLLAYADLLVDQLFNFGTATINNFDRCMGDAREATATLLTKPKVNDYKKPQPFSSIRGDIRFKSVTFSHTDKYDTALFNDLDIHIKPGEKIGLVGHSGGGKSTLTKLIMRFMDVDHGKILIDGQDIAKVSQDDLRKYIAYVPQEPIMFHRSIAENIRYGNLGASKQEVMAAAKMANSHEFIMGLPEKYDTLVGERGVKLSGGQRQRITIARAMLKNAPILLLDEATSALDSESEKLIQSALWKLMKNKTAIVIAHRLSTIQRMDRILVLENGEIVEEGSHSELLRNDGIYAELWAHQSGGFIEE